MTIPADTPATVAELRRELAAARAWNEASKDQLLRASEWSTLANERAERIAELEKLIPLVEEVMANHRDPQSGEYNECEKSPCMWCDLAQKAIDAARKED